MEKYQQALTATTTTLIECEIDELGKWQSGWDFGLRPSFSSKIRASRPNPSFLILWTSLHYSR